MSGVTGDPEDGETPELESASPFNDPGIVIAAAAGDDGYLYWGAEAASERGYVGFPASSPHVVAVGGPLIYWLEGFREDNQDKVDNLGRYFLGAAVALMLQLVFWSLALAATIS